MLLDERRQPAQQARAIGRRYSAPRRERRLRARDCGVGLLDARLLELGDRLLGRRVNDLHGHASALPSTSSSKSRGVLACFGVPEDADREPAAMDPRRASSVPSSAHRDLAQARAEPTEALVVVRLDRRAIAEDRAEPAVALEANVVVGERPGRVLVLLVADDVGQVLNEIAAERDVEHLAAAADGEHRHVALERRFEQRSSARSRSRHDAGRLGVRLLAVELGVEIGAAGEDDPVERVERLVDSVGCGGTSSGVPPARSIMRT